MRRTGHTRDGRRVVLRFNGGSLSSYKVEGQPLVRRSHFKGGSAFSQKMRLYDSVERVLFARPRPRGLPRV